jgi:CHAT domain-containing protein
VERTLPPNIQKLIIIPDRQLCYLPFEALVIPGNPSKGRRSEPVFLVEKFEVSYAPSASSLLRILDRRMEQDGQMDILAVGDPRGFGSNPESIQDEDDPFQQYYQKSHFPRFPLLFASQEMELVSRFFSRNSQVLLAQEQATEANLKRLPLADFRVIHFATHGLLDERTASRSALALALDGAGEEDGYLQAREIYELEMSADLVVLSACQTALGKMENGEGVEGIARAFFCAGTRSVVASLWNINDRSTAVFMEYFYADLTKGRTKREALALAKKRMLRSIYSSPYHWAAFILLGEAGVRMP